MHMVYALDFVHGDKRDGESCPSFCYNECRRKREEQYNLLILGGPNGETGAALRYLSQRYGMPSDKVKGVLTDIGT